MTNTGSSPLISGGQSKRPPLHLGSMGGDSARIWDLSDRLVTTFRSMLGGAFQLMRGAGGCTDCTTFVQINPEDPEGYLVTEHELSHVLFGSDPAMAGIFAEKRAQRLMDRCGLSHKTGEGAQMHAQLERLIFFIVNVLDDWRCCWLWSEIYPGGGRLLQRRWEAIATHDLQDAAEKHLLVYLARKAAGVDTPTAPQLFQECDPDIRWAVETVEGVDFTACLGIAGMLVDRLGNRLLNFEKQQRGGGGGQGGKGQQQNQQQPGGSGSQQGQQKQRPQARGAGRRGKAQEEGKQRVQTLAKHDIGPNVDVPGLGHGDRIVSAKNKSRPDASIAAQIRQVENAAKFGDGQEFQALLKQGTEEMKAKLDQARAAMAMEVKSEGEVRAEKFLAAFQVAGIPTLMVKPSRNLPSPSGIAAQIRRRLEQIQTRMRLRHAEEGIDVDFDEFIEAKLANELHLEPAVFLDMKREPGLELLFLADVSGSMLGANLTLLDHALADMDHASGTSVKLSAWAYDYQVYVFERLGSLQDVTGIRHGGTCSVQALDAAFEWAKNDKSKRAVIFATDGFPTSVRARNSTGKPIEDMRAVIEDIRSAGTPLSVLALGPESLRAQFDKAFGAGTYGLLQTLPSMNTALLRAAEVLVEQHIRRRTR